MSHTSTPPPAGGAATRGRGRAGAGAGRSRRTGGGTRCRGAGLGAVLAEASGSGRTLASTSWAGPWTIGAGRAAADGPTVPETGSGTGPWARWDTVTHPETAEAAARITKTASRRTRTTLTYRTDAVNAPEE
jgi:hypothetical protein